MYSQSTTTEGSILVLPKKITEKVMGKLLTKFYFSSFKQFTRLLVINVKSRKKLVNLKLD